MPNIIDLLTKHEARRHLLYDDATGKPITKGSTVIGNPTIGVGRCLTTNPLTDNEIDYLLTNDIKTFTSGLKKRIPWFEELNEARRAVLTSLAFQRGIGGLFKHHRTMIDLLQQKEYLNAANDLRNSAYGQAFQSRARDLANMLEKGEFVEI